MLNVPQNKKQFVNIGLAIAVVIGLGYYTIIETDILSGSKTQNDPSLSVKDPDAVMENQGGTQDSDNDGLADWEEELWGTDPNVADTDGDGTPDGEELDVGRDPTVAGPDDAREASGVAANTASSSAASENSPEEFARTFFRDYLSQRFQGRSLTSSQQEAVIQNFTRKALTMGSSTPEYSTEDFSVYEEPNETVRAQYYQTLEAKIARFGELETYELILAHKAYNDDAEAKKELENAAETFRSVSDELANMRVPKDVLERHVELVNSTQTVTQKISGLVAGIEEPLYRVSALNGFMEAEQRMRDAYEAIGSYVTRHGLATSE